MDELRKKISQGNQTTVGSTTIGGAIAVVGILLANQLGADLSGESSAMLVSAFTVIFNYFIPAKKQNGDV